MESLRARRLRLQLRLVLADERADLVRHVEQLRPLLLVERDGKPPEPVHGHPALLADLEAHPPGSARLERRILGSESLKLGLHIIVSHWRTSVRAPASPAQPIPGGGSEGRS